MEELVRVAVDVRVARCNDLGVHVSALGPGRFLPVERGQAQIRGQPLELVVDVHTHQRPERHGAGRRGPDPAGSLVPEARHQCFQVRGEGRARGPAPALGHREVLGAGRLQHPGELSAQCVEALSARRRDGHDRRSQSTLERARVYREAARGDRVHLIEDQHRRAPELEDLQREVQVAVEVRGVEHDDHELRRGVAVAAEHGVDGELFLGAARDQAVAARHVLEVAGRAPGVVQGRGADQPLDRDAGVVAHPSVRPGQAIEECRFAGVRVADDDDEGATLGNTGGRRR